MSLAPVFSVEEQGPRYLKYNLSMRLLNRVIPRILNMNVALTERIALAYSWFVFLSRMAPAICKQHCNGASGNPEKWGYQELVLVARALGDYASMLMNDALGQERSARENKLEPIKLH